MMKLKVRFIFILILGILCTNIVVTQELNHQSFNLRILETDANKTEVEFAPNPIVILGDSAFADYDFSGNGSTTNPYIIENLIIKTPSICINISNTRKHFIIYDCSISGTSSQTGYGIYLDNVTNCVISSSTISSTHEGISIHNSKFINVTNMEISDCAYGVRMNTTSDIDVNSSSISNFYLGIEIRHSLNCSLFNNTIENGTGRGTFVAFSSLIDINFCNFFNNEIDGVYFYESQFMNVTQNEIYGNMNIGLVLNYCNNSMIIENGLGWNKLNALDNGVGNKWNNSIIGNYWSNHVTGAIFSIPGSGLAKDYFPHHLLFGEAPEELSFLDTDNNFRFYINAEAFHADHYAVLLNGSVISVSKWNGLSFYFNESISLAGIFNYTIVLYNSGGYHISVTTIIRILDLISPVINHLHDIIYMTGLTGLKLRWIASDNQQLFYEIFLNNLKILEMPWTENYIEISIDGLTPGIYYYELVVHDRGGNTASDVVEVTVIPNPMENITTTSVTTTNFTTYPSFLDYAPLISGIMFLAGSFIILFSVLINRELIFSNKKSVNVSKHEPD